jgi:enoyl-[acyl-carrier protein] reductase III
VSGQRGPLEGRWALVLGASGGFGAAAARALAAAGMDILGVHLDTRRTLDRAEEVVAAVEASGRTAQFFNVNAASPAKREQVLEKIAAELSVSRSRSIHVFLHSLAFGTLRPFISDEWGAAISEEQMEMTLRVMAHSLVYWVQGLVRRDLLLPGSRVFALSSIGAERVLPNYGAVSAAKAALESHMRELSVELAPRGIMVNCLRPGVADTAASRAIPDYEQWAPLAMERNPRHRLTDPYEVASVLVALADPAITWLSGAVIPVDGGESVVG